MNYHGMHGNKFAERRAWCRIVCACHKLASDPKTMMQNIKSLPKARWALKVLRVALSQLDEATGNEEATARVMKLYNLSKPEFRSAIGNLERAMPQLPEDNEQIRQLHDERGTHLGSEIKRLDGIEINQRNRRYYRPR